jgi:hypothetical protein
MLYTSYYLARKNEACQRALDGWIKHVGGTRKLKTTKKIPLTEILDVLGLQAGE